jgi:hypothetical protein
MRAHGQMRPLESTQRLSFVVDTEVPFATSLESAARKINREIGPKIGTIHAKTTSKAPAVVWTPGRREYQKVPAVAARKDTTIICPNKPASMFIVIPQNLIHRWLHWVQICL